MPIKFSQVFTRGDKIRFGILILVAILAWLIVWREFKKPIDYNWQQAQAGILEVQE